MCTLKGRRSFILLPAQFPDALAAAAAAGGRGAPVLLTQSSSLPVETAAALRQLRPDRVIIVGSQSAVTEAVVTAVQSIGVSSVTRLGGVDRYVTAVEVSKEAFPAGASTVFVATGTNFPDALAAAAAAAHRQGPILMSSPSSLPPSVETELRRLSPARVVLAGGTGALSAAVESRIREVLPAATVQRVGGTNRYETASLLANEFESTTGFYLASGTGFADALVAAAAAGHQGQPVLLTPPRSLATQVSARLPRPPANTPPTTQQPSDFTQAIIYSTFGCRNQIRIRAMDYTGKNLAERVLVRSTGNVQLMVYAVSNQEDEIIFGTFNCDTNERAVYRQSLSTNPTAIPILNLPANWTLIGATWDVARRAPSVFLQDPTRGYSIQTLIRNEWSIVGSFSRTTFGSHPPWGFRSDTGFEFEIWGNSSSSWKEWRVSRNGDLSEQMSGAGTLNSKAATVLEQAQAYFGSTGTWICDGFANGAISNLVTQGRCSFVESSPASYGAFIYANPNATSYWLYMTPSGLIFPNRVRFDCVGATLFSCGTPFVRESRRSDLAGNYLHYVSLFDIPDFNGLASTNIP